MRAESDQISGAITIFSDHASALWEATSDTGGTGADISLPSGTGAHAGSLNGGATGLGSMGNR